MRFTLTIDARGGAILSTPDPVSADKVAEIKAAFARWSAAQPPEALIVPECDVVRVVDVELVLEPAGAA